LNFVRTFTLGVTEIFIINFIYHIYELRIDAVVFYRTGSKGLAAKNMQSIPCLYNFENL
jgi:hypothetical protein